MTPDQEASLRGRLTRKALAAAQDRGYGLRDRKAQLSARASAGASLWRLTRGYVVVWCKGEREGSAWILDAAEAHGEFALIRAQVIEVDRTVKGGVPSSHTVT